MDSLSPLKFHIIASQSLENNGTLGPPHLAGFWLTLTFPKSGLGRSAMLIVTVLYVSLLYVSLLKEIEGLQSATIQRKLDWSKMLVDAKEQRCICATTRIQRAKTESGQIAKARTLVRGLRIEQ